MVRVVVCSPIIYFHAAGAEAALVWRWRWNGERGNSGIPGGGKAG